MQLPFRKPGKYSTQTNDPMLSSKKLKELKNDLIKLKKKKPYAMSEVSRLAELGDFSENVEYQLAKRRLRGINNAILRLEIQINSAIIIKTSSTGRVEIGNTVIVEQKGVKKTFTILGSSESEPSKDIISHNSPLGSSLIGKKVGDEVVVDLPKGKIVFVILKIR